MLPKSRPGEAPETTGYDKNDFTYGGRSVIAKRKDVRVVFPSADVGVKGRILPSMDLSLTPSDEAFPTSWLPYRDKDVVSSSGHPAFNYWFYDQFEVYRFWGPNNRSFLSPRTKVKMGLASRQEVIDPIDRMNNLVRKSPEKWGNLSAHIRPSGDIRKFKPLLLLPQDVGLCNFYGTVGDDQEPSNFLLGLSGGGFTYVTNQLQKFTVPNTQPRDPNWATYLLGDVTHPRTGLKAWSCQKVLGAAGRPANVVVFSTKEDFLSGHEVIPVDDTVLRNRINFVDLDETMHIPSLDEMVSWLLEVPDIPVELIREAVEGRIHVPDRTTANMTAALPSNPAASATGSQKPLPFVSKAPVQETEDDDTPPWIVSKTDAPAVEKEAPSTSALTAAEEGELEYLSKLMAEGKMHEAGTTGYARYFELVNKASAVG